jgi:hypothetical protein
MKDFSLAPLFSFNSYSKHIKQLFLTDNTNVGLDDIASIFEKYLASYGTQTS